LFSTFRSSRVLSGDHTGLLPAKRLLVNHPSLSVSTVFNPVPSGWISTQRFSDA